MSNLQDNNLTIEQLLGAVKQLPPAELREFTRQFLAWQSLVKEQNGVALHEVTSLRSKPLSPKRTEPIEQVSQSEIPQQRSSAEEEAALLACISENSRLPAAEQQRYEFLRRKCEDKTLTEIELTEYQSLLRHLEARNVKRIEALVALAQQRGTTLRGIMTELGLKGDDDAF